MNNIDLNEPGAPAQWRDRRELSHLSVTAELVLAELLEQIALARKRSRRTKVAAFRNRLRWIINRALNRILPGAPAHQKAAVHHVRPRNTSGHP